VEKNFLLQVNISISYPEIKLMGFIQDANSVADLIKIPSSKTIAKRFRYSVKNIIRKIRTLFLTRNKRWADKNKERRSIYNKKWREENKERVTFNLKRYYQENKEFAKKKAAEYRNDNPERIAQWRTAYYENNKERIIDANKLYHRNNRDKYVIINERRRARQRLLPATLTNEQWEKCKTYFNNSCAFCGEKKPLEQEHFIPVTKDGEYSHNNIIPACKSCNDSKNAKSFFVWYPKFKHYSKQREQKILKYLGYKNGIQQLSLL